MRDIRGDLQDRAALLEEQINAQEAQFDQLIEQLKIEHDARLEDFRAELDAVNRLMELELRRIDATAAGQRAQAHEPLVQPIHQPHQHVQPQQPQPQAPHQHVQPQPPQPQAPHQHVQPQPQAPHQHAQPQPAHQSVQPQQQPQAQRQPQQPLADFLIRKLNEAGAMPPARAARGLFHRRRDGGPGRAYHADQRGEGRSHPAIAQWELRARDRARHDQAETRDVASLSGALSL
jgi:hypothetical protein